MNMKQLTFSGILFAAMMIMSNLTSAQCDSIAARCQRHINENYISDGQTYRVLLSGDEMTEFQTTMYKDNTYRIAACSGNTENNLIFKLIDQDRNILFSSADYANSEYWDFFAENTMSVTIEAQLDSRKSDSGCAVIVIGFKK
jgi:hypothetical protein